MTMDSTRAGSAPTEVELNDVDSWAGVYVWVDDEGVAGVNVDAGGVVDGERGDARLTPGEARALATVLREAADVAEQHAEERSLRQGSGNE